MNQHDALFFTLFPYHASTCFGVICSPSSGGQVYNVAVVLDLLVRRLSAGLDENELQFLLIQARKHPLSTVASVPIYRLIPTEI
jgi:hypothetical protein